MRKRSKSKILAFGLVAVLVVMMMVATIIEKVLSSDAAFSLVYHSPVFILLWVGAVVSGCIWIWKVGLWKRPVVLCLHFSFVIILSGALVSHLTSESGVVHLRIQQSTDSFVTEEGETKALPFTITLEDFQVKRYPGGSAAMDYTSEVTVKGKDGCSGHTVSMNNILKKDGFRIYQSSYDEDEKGSVFSVSHDPYGVTLTYIGYFLLFICLVGFFFCKKTEFRVALSRLSKGSALTFLLMVGLSSPKVSAMDSTDSPSMAQMMKEGSSLALKSIPKDVADSLCNLFVSYGGRMAPLQTMARDYVMKVYGKPRVKGYSAEEVFAGWIFYFDTWKSVPVKLKKKEIGTSKEYEKYYAIQSVASRKALKIFPYVCVDSTDRAGTMEWFSPSGDLPYDMNEKEWLFIRKVFTLIGEKIYSEDYQGAKEVIAKISKYQSVVAGDILPLPAKIKAEKAYNKIARPMAQAMACVTLGMVLFVLMGVYISRRKRLPGWVNNLVGAFTVLLAAYLTVVLALRWYVSGHIPMAGGFEMMLLIAWIAMIFTSAVYKKMPVFQPLGLILAGFALLVAVLGESRAHLQSSVFKLSKDLIDSIHEEGIVAYTS